MTPLAKKLLIALIVSVGVNLALLGFLAGRAFRPFPGPRPVSGPTGPGPRPGFFAGPPAELRARLHETREARARVAEALEHEPFDTATLESALRALRTETTQGQETLHAELVRRAGSATPEARRALAGQFRRGRFWKGK
ncbi:MAG TPA: periplasmic heavy metal sensor [Polyangiaceae bacterium]|nr:periplasmic heavy metal sensor [Polyangiaceae bacterium]